jgi:hypothetical protein
VLEIEDGRKKDVIAHHEEAARRMADKEQEE